MYNNMYFGTRIIRDVNLKHIRYVVLFLLMFFFCNSCNNKSSNDKISDFQKDHPVNANIAEILGENSEMEESVNVPLLLNHLQEPQRKYFDMYAHVFVGLDDKLKQELKGNNTIFLYQLITTTADDKWSWAKAYYKKVGDTRLVKIPAKLLIERQSDISDIMHGKKRNFEKEKLFESYKSTTTASDESMLSKISDSKYIVIAGILSEQEIEQVNYIAYRCKVYDCSSKGKISDFILLIGNTPAANFIKDSRSDVLDHKEQVFEYWAKGLLPFN